MLNAIMTGKGRKFERSIKYLVSSIRTFTQQVIMYLDTKYLILATQKLLYLPP